MNHVSPAARHLLFVAALLLAGCATPRVDYAARPSAVSVAADEVAAGEALYPIVEAGQWGYMNRTGDVVISPRYDFATPFVEGRAGVRNDGTWGFISPTGSWVVEPTYGTANHFSDGRALVSMGSGKKRRFGFIDASGAEVVAVALPYALSYSEGLALVQIRTETETFLQRLLSRLGVAGEGSRPYAFLDRDGNVAFDVPGMWAASFAGGLAPFEQSRGIFRSTTWGYLDREGNVVVEPTLDGPAFRHTDGLARVGESGRLGFVDASGQFVIAPDYELARPFSGGLAPVHVDGRWGFVDEAGALVITPRFQQALGFSEGLAPVQTETGWGYVNEAGDLAIPATYTRADRFDRGLARVYIGRLLRYIDVSGETVWAQQ